MCVVSMVMDHYVDKWGKLRPQPFEQPYPVNPTTPNLPSGWEDFIKPKPKQITPEEIEEFRKLLERAREYDKKNNEPNCELAEKRDKILKLAKELGVEITFL